MAKINVESTQISITTPAERDCISFTEMANAKESMSRAADIIINWLRTRYTLEYLRIWELIHNPNFNVVEFDHFKTQVGLPSFVLSVSEWIDKTKAIRRNLIPTERISGHPSILYSSEADVLNVALFCMTAKQWREANLELSRSCRMLKTGSY